MNELEQYAGRDELIDNRNKLVFKDKEELIKAMDGSISKKDMKKIIDWHFDNMNKLLQEHSPIHHLHNSPQV